MDERNTSTIDNAALPDAKHLHPFAHQAITAANPGSVSFKDEYGATISIDAEALELYATTKSNQLNALNSILADHIAGNEVELTGKKITAIAGLASELAWICDRFMCAMCGALQSRTTAESAAQEGGAQ